MKMYEMLLNDACISDNEILEITEFGNAIVEISFDSDETAESFCNWLGVNIELYDGAYTQFYKTLDNCVTIELK